MISRRTLLKSLAAVTAGLTALAKRPLVEATGPEDVTIDVGQRWNWETQTVSTSQTFGLTVSVGDFGPAQHDHTDYFETARFDASMTSWDKLVDFYDVDGELRTYRLTSAGIYPV